MPDTYQHELTATEIECGVTLDEVRRELARVLVRDNQCVIDANSPALAGSVARAALRGPVTFRGYNQIGHAVYEAA